MNFKSWPQDKPYSFSALTSFEECPAMFAMNYLADHKIASEQNAFAEYGILCHELLDKYAKNELCDFELAAEYEARYPDVVVHNFHPIPKSYPETAYNKGLEYFESFTGFGDEYEILDSEVEFVTTIAGHKFKGIVDLILKRIDDGKLIIIDHKSKSAAGMKKDFPTYVKQLYLYSIYVKEKYGEYPVLLRFNVFKEKQYFDEVFSEDKLNEVVGWLDHIVTMIELEDEFNPKPPSEYFCKWICSYSTHCPASPFYDPNQPES